MVANGMLALGYKLILLDDCWANTSRDVNGDLHPDPARFPSGIAPLVKYVEDRGFYLGLYTCAGTETCKYGKPRSNATMYTSLRSAGRPRSGLCYI